jgi:hypothetical protein
MQPSRWPSGAAGEPQLRTDRLVGTRNSPASKYPPAVPVETAQSSPLSRPPNSRGNRYRSGVRACLRTQKPTERLPIHLARTIDVNRWR